MIYRTAGLQDGNRLAALRAEMLAESGCPSALLARAAENTKLFFDEGLQNNTYVVWIAEEEGEVAAMGGVNFFSLPPNDWCPEGKTAYIGNLFTRPAFRRRKAASCILERLLDEAKRRGCQRILLHTTEAGQSLYEIYGFQPSPTAMALYPFGIA